MKQLRLLVRKWGDSMAVIIPSKIAKEKSIAVDDEIVVTLEKETSLKDLFGTWRTNKTAQELKNESREDWE